MKVRLAIVVTCLAAILILPVAASAAISRLDLGPQAELGPEGAFVRVPITYQCDFFDGGIFISVQVTQSRGNRTANGSGFFQGSCTSSPQTVLVEVQSFTGVPYHHGKAVARASASTFTGSSASDGPEEIRIG
jgi:hypothetical protein